MLADPFLRSNLDVEWRDWPAVIEEDHIYTIMIAQHQHQTVLQSPEGPASLGSVQLDQLAVGKVTFLKMFWR